MVIDDDHSRYSLTISRRPTPHQVLLQPLVPQLAQHYELKIYFLRREPFYASLVYGEHLLPCSCPS